MVDVAVLGCGFGPFDGRLGIGKADLAALLGDGPADCVDSVGDVGVGGEEVSTSLVSGFELPGVLL